MGTSGPDASGRNTAMRIMIVDDHEISRAACRALLRAEGADVVADLGVCDDALEAARTLHPEVVLIDVTPAAGIGLGTARAMRGLPTPPIVILTSSADLAQFGPEVNGYEFIAKADISATLIAALTDIPNRPGQTARARLLPGHE